MIQLAQYLEEIKQQSLRTYGNSRSSHTITGEISSNLRAVSMEPNDLHAWVTLIADACEGVTRSCNSTPFAITQALVNELGRRCQVRSRADVNESLQPRDAQLRYSQRNRPSKPVEVHQEPIEDGQ